MNEQNIPQSSEPIQSSKNIWITVIIITVTTLIAGSVIYAWTSYSAKTVEHNLRNEIDRLNTELTKNIQNQNELQSQLKELQEQTKVRQAATPLEEKNANAPQWLTYKDQDISFQYPKTLCGTSWQEEWDTHSCDEDWEVERTKSGHSSSDYAGGEKYPVGSYIQIMPSYSSFGFEFGGDIQIIFVSKEKFDENISDKSLQQQTMQKGYQVYIEEGITGYPAKISNYYLTNGSKYITVSNNFPDRYPKYFSFLIDSIELK
ncbi:MAG: hypothetical protein PHH24_02950 [Candidatus Moranbacteria bacterium]|nr:hypothetical protein [Candidatus Moranbacteria bacterium]MDD5651971.1 hypothetical protein [Candidatus Moranbacteria bacterium]